MGANVLVEFENVFLIGGIFFKLGAMGANVLVEFENIFLIEGIFLNWGQMGANVLLEFEKKKFDWGHFFFNLGAMGANGLVEFENVVLIGSILFTIGGIFFLSWGQKIILGSRKSAILGIVWTSLTGVGRVESPPL